MRPFFSYYGAKYTAAKHLGPPRHPVVVEPFAGSACYSTRWDVPVARLYDVSPDICALWDFLIKCSDRDIARIPDAFEHMDQVFGLPIGAQMLCRFWVAKGRAEPTGVLSPWYFEWRNSTDCRVWGPAVKDRIIRQKPMIAKWRIEQSSWVDIPLQVAHWHVDPPYNNASGARYPHSRIDFEALASWCMTLPGHVDVCENVGAQWMDFEPLCQVLSSRGRRDGSMSAEAVWRKAV